MVGMQKELALGQCHFYKSHQHLLIEESLSCRIKIEKRRSLFTTYVGFQPERDVDDCTRPEKRKNCLELYTRRLEVCIHGSDKRQIQEATGDQIDVIEGASILKAKKKKKDT